VLAWSGADGAARPTHRVLTGAEIRELAARPGHSIGAHTAHHLALSAHPLERKQQDVVEHKIALERLLQRPVHLFSYPYGDFDAQTLAVVGAAGFRGAVTVEPGLVSAGTNRLLLPRYEIGPHRVDLQSYLSEVVGGCLVSR
jgi:peptidoglycan/xylan/chitin deacetylase (PgdA/CDA1 family)